MSKPTFWVASLAAFGASLISVHAHATIFTSSSDFLAATSSLTVEDYGSYSSGTLVADASTLGALTYTFNTASGLGGVVTGGIYNSFSGNSLAAKQVAGPLSNLDFFYSAESFTVTFPNAVTAIGIFSNTNLPDDASIATTSGTVSTTFTTYDTNTFGFLGFTSSTPFTSATFTSSNFNVPEIEYGISAVPETSTWVMMLVGFAGLGFAGYRSSRKANLAA